MDKQITLGSGETIKFWYNKKNKRVRLSEKDTALITSKFSYAHILQNLVSTMLYNFNREGKQMFIYFPKYLYIQDTIRSYNRHVIGLSEDDTIYININ